jgi:ABC-2 type transport system ATP-binding protein
MPFDAPHPLALSTSGLTKAYGERTAVSDLNLAIPQGVISGFVGPNGAGKTTTIRMLLGLISPSAGSGEVLGADLGAPQDFLHRVGAMIESPAFYPALSGRRNLEVLARLGGITDLNIDRAIRQVDLTDRANDPFRSYSLGMKQRLGIAAALLPSPALLILDEPTNGLDPAGIAEMRVLLRTLADDGMTIFVSSHLLSEIAQICQHLVVISAGRIVYQGHIDDLTNRTRSLLRATPELPRMLVTLEQLAADLGMATQLEHGSLVAEGDISEAALLFRAAARSDITLVRLDVVRPSLEDTFLALTGCDAAEDTQESVATTQDGPHG